jgi:hypothetical protein
MTPCYGCLERNVGCHGSCEKYKSWEAAHQKRRKIIAENRKQSDSQHKRRIRGKLVDSF